MNKLILGRYLPGDSIIYRLDPRGKFLITFYFIGIVFLANNVISYGFCCYLSYSQSIYLKLT
jgi:ABC-type cobalt transport system, permease component CbiQ and related transporters